jgi:hypothetical protein
MNRFAFAGIALCVLGGAVVNGDAQTTSPQYSFQYVTSAGTGGNIMFGAETLGGKTVAGKPFLGTEERHSTQVLGDGTRIETTDTDKIYRDDGGRTRIERDSGKYVTISDPVAGTSAELDTVNKTVRKSTVRTVYQVRTDGRGEPTVSVDQIKMDQVKKQVGEAAMAPPPVMIYRGPETARTNTITISGSAAMEGDVHAKMIAETGATAATPVGGTFNVAVGGKGALEDLGTQMVNGVMAHGNRSTLTIPIGQIGNDREIKVISEQWYSNDLQMMVKSSNSDPRFGNTTYQLSGIVQVAPDPSLFEVSADYTPASMFVPRMK